MKQSNLIGSTTIKLDKITIGLFVWVALQAIVANFSIYYSYGLWLLSFAFLIIDLFFNNHVISQNKRTPLVYLVGFGTPYFISTVFNGCVPDKTYFIYLIYGFCFLILKRDIQYRVVYSFTWCWAVILFISIVEYLLFNFFNIGIVVGFVSRNQTQGVNSFYHLLFNLIGTDRLPRFQFVSEEAGLVGTLCGFLLFYTGRNRKLKFPFNIFLLCGIFTFSLAFYVIASLYLILGNFQWKKAIFVVTSILIIGEFANTYVNELVIQRIVDKNIEELDNRTTATFDWRFSQAWENGQLWLGVGANNLPQDINYGISTKNEGGNAGAKKWIFQYGIISLIILFFCILMVYRRLRGQKLRYYDVVFLCVFWLSYYQRSLISACYYLLALFAIPLSEYNHYLESEGGDK